MVLRVGGLTQKLKSQQISPSNPLMGHLQFKDQVMKFDCANLSCFAEEKESLFFGGDTVLRIKGIIHCAGGVWMKYDKYLEAINVFSRMMDGLSVKQQPIISKKRDQKMMKRMIKDVLRSLIWRLDDAETPKYVHELMMFHVSNVVRVQLIYDELLTEYKWLECIFKDVITDTLNFANIAFIFCHSENITFSMSENYEFSEAECTSLMDELILMANMGLETTLLLTWPSGVPESTQSKVINAYVTSSMFSYGIFGDFGVNTVSFTLNNARLGYETQQQYLLRVYSMITRLSTDVGSAVAVTPSDEVRSDAKTEAVSYVTSSNHRMSSN